MRNSKPGLADLKRLARAASAAPPAQVPSRPLAGRAASAGASAATSSSKATAATAISAPPALPAVTAQDRAFFRRMVGTVSPVDTRNRLLHAPPQRDALPVRARAETTPRQGPADASDRPSDAGLSDSGVSHLLCEDGTAFLRQGVGPEILKKIRQRYWRIEADIDLHGMTIDQARSRLADFIVQCVAYDARCVRIVHGQGFGSPDALPVLRDKVRAWLVGLVDVRAFAQAPQRDGGAGATIVLLRADDRRSRDRRN